MKHLPFPQNWTVTAVGDSSAVPENIAGRAIPAIVPGCVHTDLLAAELIPDPYLDENEKLVQWIGHASWCYAGTFELGAQDLMAPQIELACDGLDTIATVELNGQIIGRTQNMHTRHRFDAKPTLRVGTNELNITFAPVLAYAETMRDRLGDLPVAGSGSNPQLPHHFIRKMACNMGWDWGPCLITAGIWREMRLEAWHAARLADVRPVTRSLGDDGSATLDVQVDLERAGRGDVIIQAALAGHGYTKQLAQTLTGDRFADPITFDVPDAQRWWPVGHGEQPLYDLTVWLEDDRGETLEKRTHRIGLRTTEIDTSDDNPNSLPGHIDGTQPGAGMMLKINGKPIFCKGANWIPDDCFPTRITKNRLRQRISQARDAHMNMLRVWGGGMYESHDFYDLCDEMGMLVWQDFLLACAAYAEEEPLLTLIEDEARDNVARLAAHPSLVMWCGNNENLWAYDRWWYQGKSWRDFIGERGWGPKYYFELLPPVVAELAPGTPYWPGSPYSGEDQPDPNANEFGDKHIWDVWHGKGQYRNYLGHSPRFASEFGYHGPPSWPNIEASVPADQWAWNSAGMNHHNKNSSQRPGQQQTHDRMGDDFVQPAPAPGSRADDSEALASFNDWLYLAQVMQARALDMGVSWFRALHPYCSGALYWQLNDCWPVSSWSAIDSDGRLKPLWYASKRFFAPRLLTIKPQQVVDKDEPIGKLALYAHNDSDTPWRGVVRLQLMDLQGKSHHAQGVTIDIAARDCQRFDIPETWHHDTDQRFIAAEFLGNDAEEDHNLFAAPAFWWFRPDKELGYAEIDLGAMLEHDASADTYYLTVTAHNVIRDLCVFADRLDPEAVVSDQCVTLLPGQSFEFAIQSQADLKLEDLTAPPVMQAVNRFGRQAMLV